jgi:hypothetical protein
LNAWRNHKPRAAGFEFDDKLLALVRAASPASVLGAGKTYHRGYGDGPDYRSGTRARPACRAG